MISKKNKVLNKVLIALHVFLGLGGIGGGVPMLMDPSGSMMGLPSDLLDDLLISNFVLPGIFLILVMGITPLTAAYGLWKNPDGFIMEKINPFPKQNWSWSLSLVIGLLLIIWIGFQILLWGEPIFIQYLYMMIGILISGFTLLTAGQQ